MKLLKFSVLFIIPLLVSCTKSLQITYKSDPQSATLYQGGLNYGRMPKTLVYDLSEEDETKGYKEIDTATARWISGATANAPKRKILINDKLKHEYTFVRPDVPGASIDAEFATEMIKVEMEQKRAAEAAAAAAEAAEAAAKRAEDRQQQMLHEQTLIMQHHTFIN